MAGATELVRPVWTLYEPVHVVSYFTPEAPGVPLRAALDVPRERLIPARG
jgi:hypothetical protein